MEQPTRDTPWMSYEAWKYEREWLAEQERLAIGTFRCGYSDEELAQLQARTHYTQIDRAGT